MKRKEKTQLFFCFWLFGLPCAETLASTATARPIPMLASRAPFHVYPQNLILYS